MSITTGSTTTTESRAAHGVRPTQPAPDLTVPLLRGGTYRLSEQRPKLFTMVVVDTTRPVLVWEVPYYPTYYFPLADVRADGDVLEFHCEVA